jgi:hypothetical protein
MRLFLFTDGFCDALSPQGEPFQETPAFQRAVEGALTGSPREARAHLERSLLDHILDSPQEDDRAYLVAALI